MKNPQFLNTILIIIGSSMLAYHLISGDENVIIQVGGIILLMLGAYRASVYWSQHKDDHLDDQD
ncbi:hypothetical protein BST97_04640 [Nonlabens spongiae]|uniref:Uncharacterized protein n=1 Tax=Nonlabens spongiae TaxID=331648 RepID=A0A1W6MIK1_9FLAO|nr:hypothetical protein [Nonlabens spongiae]ARN77326.1 hypothetical protein BST97_04640 [Nonlabens spongiae]